MVGKNRSTKNARREFVAALKAESSALALEIAARTEELNEQLEQKARVDALIATYEGNAPTKSAVAVVLPKSETRVPPKSKLKAVPHGGLFYGLSLQEAARKQLSIHSAPLTAQEIWPTLEAAGFVLGSQRPTHAIHWALRKRSSKHGDVILVGGGKWALTEWYDDEQRRKIERNLGGMSGRNSKAHSAKTKLGMKLSQERGVRLGAPTKMTPENISKAEEMLKAGRSVESVAAELEVSKPSVYAHFKMVRQNGSVTVMRKAEANQAQRSVH